MNKFKSNKENGATQPCIENNVNLAAANNDVAIDHARDACNIAGAARSFIHDNIAPVMRAIAVLSNSDSADIGASHSYLRLINDLAKLGCQLVEEATACMESDEDEMQGKLAMLEGGAQ